MRQGPHSKRGRGRGNNRRPNVPNRNQTFDSNGPDVRIRGNAHQVYEKYLTLARDASTAGDRVLAESLFQHADHYFRIYSMYNEENEARRNTAQQESGSQPDFQQRGDSDNDGDEQNDQPQPQQQHHRSDDDQSSPRRTRSERRQDAEAAEQDDQQQERPARPPRRRRNGGGAPEAGASGSDNDAALRAMLGASDSGLPKAIPGTAAEEGEQADAGEEPKPVRRRGRPRKVAAPEEQALPLGGED